MPRGRRMFYTGRRPGSVKLQPCCQAVHQQQLRILDLHRASTSPGKLPQPTAAPIAAAQRLPGPPYSLPRLCP
ncbi:hypothetical protein HaLaN_31149, partial [Haematococcus lacustris]